MRRGDIKQAAEHTGLSIWELRTGALSGKYPAMRIGGPRGKFWFDLDLLDEAIERLMLENTMPAVTDNQRGVIRRIV
ncbi:MAG: hypothetical protein LBI19_10820 [Oscillospiraceae bacterium]|jgi:hypothetical protein|nr:hypothetical protein [Oscillospiraceae bacterium]